MRKPAPFTQATVRRLIRAAQSVGWEAPELNVLLLADGGVLFSIRPGVAVAAVKSDDVPATNEWDTVQ
jgi:hypothetical protein